MPVGARYSPKTRRSASAHSPVVPARAQAIEGSMMFARRAARSSSFGAFDRPAIALRC